MADNDIALIINDIMSQYNSLSQEEKDRIAYKQEQDRMAYIQNLNVIPIPRVFEKPEITSKVTSSQNDFKPFFTNSSVSIHKILIGIGIIFLLPFALNFIGKTKK